MRKRTARGTTALAMHAHQPSRTARHAVRGLVVTLACLATLATAGLMSCLTSCSRAPDPTAAWPEGVLLSARTASLAALLAQLETLESTPIARHATAWARALPDCDEVEARAESISALPQALACRTPGGALEPFHRARGEADLAFALPGDGERTHGTILTKGHEVMATLRWPEPGRAGAWSLLVPGAEAAGPALLAAEGRLLHARVRPADGVDLASLVPAESQADRLFRLRSSLFAGAVLDGTWEIALYAPDAGQTMPRAALALGTSLRGAAVTAAEQFLRDLEATWPVHRTPFALDGAEGACLLELNVLPALAPCFVATEKALVFGWNPASLATALHPAPPMPSPPDAGRVVVDLASLGRVDARLAALLPAEHGSPPLHWPWGVFEARGRRDAEALELRLALTGAPE